MRERGWSMGKLADHLHTQTGMVSKYLFGDVRPKWEWAAKLRDALNIPLESWSQEPSEPIVLTDSEAA